MERLHLIKLRMLTTSVTENRQRWSALRSGSLPLFIVGGDGSGSPGFPQHLAQCSVNRGELKTSPSAPQRWSTDEDEAGYTEGSRPQRWGADGEEVGVGRWLSTHRGPLDPARVRGPPCGLAEPVPVSLARLLWLPERQLAGRVGPIFSDSTLPPARRPHDWLWVGPFGP